MLFVYVYDYVYETKVAGGWLRVAGGEKKA